jgi:hypothetical protein
MGEWQGVAIDSLNFHPGPPCPTLLCPAGRAACGHLLPFWTPYAVRLWLTFIEPKTNNFLPTVLLPGLEPIVEEEFENSGEVTSNAFSQETSGDAIPAVMDSSKNSNIPSTDAAQTGVEKVDAMIRQTLSGYWNPLDSN